MVKIDQKPEQLFPVICSWCGCVCDFSVCDHSHGICSLCARKLLTESRFKKDPRE
jgi:hypothetical protein